jgi:hypothetical protein
VLAIAAGPNTVGFVPTIHSRELSEDKARLPGARMWLKASETEVEVRPSPLSGTRKIVDVIFAYTDRKTDFTEKFCVRVDVTEEFPLLVTKLSPYYDR